MNTQPYTIKKKGRYTLKIHPLQMKQVNGTVVNKLAVKDIMFKRRKLWYKLYKTLYEPIMLQQGKLKKQDLYVRQKAESERKDSQSMKSGTKTPTKEPEAQEILGPKTARGKSKGNIIDRVNCMLREFEGEILEKKNAQVRKKQEAKQKLDRQRMREYKKKFVDEEKSDVTVEFEQDYQDEDDYGVEQDDFESLSQKKLVVRDLDAPESEIRVFKELLLHSAGIFERKNLKTRSLATSQCERKSNLFSKRNSDTQARHMENHEHDMQLIMNNNLETKEDVIRFFNSKNVSHMMKCLFGRKSAINKAKRIAALKSKYINRRKQVIRNKEFYNLKLSSKNKERLQEVHHLENFSKANNTLNPKLKINNEAQFLKLNSIFHGKSKKSLQDIKMKAVKPKRSSTKDVGIHNFGSNTLNTRMMTITVSAPREEDEFDDSLNTESLKSNSEFPDSSKKIIPDSPSPIHYNIEVGDPDESPTPYLFSKAISSPNFEHIKLHKGDMTSPKTGNTFKSPKEAPIYQNLNQIDEIPSKRVPKTSHMSKRKKLRGSHSQPTNLLEGGRSSMNNLLYMNPDKQKAMQIFDGLDNILNPTDPQHKGVQIGKMGSQQKFLLSEEEGLNKDFDKLEELVAEDKKELVIDKDIILGAIKLHQKQMKVNELDSRFKYSKFREFGLKRIISLDDNSSHDESEEEEREQFRKKVEARLKIKPKYTTLKRKIRQR